MLKNGKKECPLAHEIVSYIYGEIGGKSELEFETHLADCMTCTDEFAAVSQARFSVYEWQKEEFAHLPTPSIVIPYAATVNSGEAVGLVAAVRAWLGSLSFPVAVAAALAVCLALGLLALNLVGRKDQSMAVNIATSAVDPSTISPAIPVPRPKMVETAGKNYVERTPQPIKSAAIQSRRPVRHSLPDVDRSGDDLIKMPIQSPRVAKAPVLSIYEDNDDSSLRLADLFDEVGG